MFRKQLLASEMHQIHNCSLTVYSKHLFYFVGLFVEAGSHYVALSGPELLGPQELLQKMGVRKPAILLSFPPSLMVLSGKTLLNSNVNLALLCTSLCQRYDTKAL